MAHANTSLAERAYLRANAHRLAPCSCGGPALGTDHAPDCAYVHSLDDLAEDFREEQQEREWQCQEDAADQG